MRFYNVKTNEVEGGIETICERCLNESGHSGGKETFSLEAECDYCEATAKPRLYDAGNGRKVTVPENDN